MIDAAGARSVYLGYHPSFGAMPYPGVLCTSVNDAALHGLPSDYVLADGDVLSIDFAAQLQGWVADSALTFQIGTQDPAVQKLIETTERALDAGIAARAVGGTDGRHLVGHRHHRSRRRVRDQRRLRRSRRRPHDARGPARAQPRRPRHRAQAQGRGSSSPIEPWFMAGGDDYTIDDDGWTIRTADGSLAAHAEHTVALTPDGPLVLTARDRPSPTSGPTIGLRPLESDERIDDRQRCAR